MKLTNLHRERIISVLKDRAFADDKKQIKELEYALADKVFDDVISEDDRMKMADLPEGFFPEVKVIRVSFHENYAHLNMRTDRRVTYKMYTNCRALKRYPDDHPLYKEWKEFDLAYAKHVLEQQAKTAELNAILYECSTVKQLITAWPELKDLLDELGFFKKKAKPMLPAVRHDLNRLFKLPPRRCGNCGETVNGPTCGKQDEIVEVEVPEDHTCEHWYPRTEQE